MKEGAWEPSVSKSRCGKVGISVSEGFRLDIFPFHCVDLSVQLEVL